ncbi:adenylate/guanylate cyclase domain-containing protein [Caballeronia sp. LP003]|uniref:adenylate/guanylate cyclase domain-containing protein n=1 Tax=Caballeronia sp. LP003 TaxID=3038551 RepID=UPI002866D198|nr:adenylate/guanylate cyclase domain-containing protein [Caballeronia sp. LP003]MDR5786646.1 adenylate/guanylate cyclase domain-containing protein [Caballeronia sp. LP003]
MECPSCKTVVLHGNGFCVECGERLPVECPSCTHPNPPHAKFCGGRGSRLNIGAATASVEAPATPAPGHELPSPSAERRQVTVMFSDLVGSTALATRLDPEDLHDVINAYHTCVADAVNSFGGFVAKYMGDGVLIYFGYPRAHEDDAERAVRAALAIIEACALQASGLAPGRLQVRVGIATGLVVIGDLTGAGEAQERGIVGETPNLAARMQALAEPDAVVIEPQTRLILGNMFEYRDLGKAQVKGFAQAVQAFQVIGLSAIDSRFEALHSTDLTPLVGRDEETRLLLRRWEKAKAAASKTATSPDIRLQPILSRPIHTKTGASGTRSYMVLEEYWQADVHGDEILSIADVSAVGATTAAQSSRVAKRSGRKIRSSCAQHVADLGVTARGKDLKPDGFRIFAVSARHDSVPTI